MPVSSNVRPLEMLSLVTDPNAAAMWSALAATFAAVAAFLTWAAQIRTLRETFKPEIALYGWSRASNETLNQDSIRFSGIKNVGRGTAKQIVVNAIDKADDGRLTYSMSTLQLPSLAPNEAATINCEILLWWKSVALQSAGPKSLGLTITAYYWDSLQIRHRVKLSMLVAEDPSAAHMASVVAPGVMLSRIELQSRPVWRLRVGQALSRIPIIGTKFREEA